MKPFVKITMGGADITSRFSNYNMSVNITDGRGEDADTVDITVDDTDGQIQAPRTGVKLGIEGGYIDGDSKFFGEFTVDRVDFDGYPQKVTIHGAAVAAKEANKQRRTEAHKAPETKTFGDLAKKLAGRNGWTPAIDEALAAKKIEYEGQAEEDDLALLTRVARRMNGIVSVKQGRLIIKPPGSGKGAGGTALPQIAIRPGLNLLDYSCSWKDKPIHGEVEAHIFDRAKVERKDIKGAGSGEAAAAMILREGFQNEDEAKDAVEAKKSELERGEGSANFTIIGTPSVVAEVPVVASGIRTRVNGVWNPTSVTHSFTESDYTTSLTCEVPGSNGGGGGNGGES